MVFVLFFIFVSFVLKTTYALEDNNFNTVSDIDYQEDISNIRNPERGFYEPLNYNLKESGNEVIDSLPDSHLFHLRVGIGAFSSNGKNSQDINITDDALKALKDILTKVKKNNGSVIIRFSYDDFEGKSNTEPASMNVILKHIEQLGKVLLENRDVVTLIEIGFIGQWGELHDSTLVTNDNISLIVDKLLSVTDCKIRLSLRTPSQYAYWKGINDISKINNDISENGTKAYLVGIYDDGYLGSESDLGTYINREIEVAWLNNQAKHAFFGGELSLNYNFGGLPLNTIEFIQKEGYLTHTTYLNSQWTDAVINSFKIAPYVGDNELYKNSTAYEYLDNHLGYRFVLRNSALTNNIGIGEYLNIKLKIENVGFANLINDKIVSIVLSNDQNVYEIKTNIEPTNWDSLKINEVNMSLDLPADIVKGNYKVYLRISKYANLENDGNYHCIRMANKNIYDSEIGANYIGEVNISAKEDISSPPTGEFISYILIGFSLFVALIILVLANRNKRFYRV